MRRLALLLSFALGLIVSGCGGSEPPARIMILGLDGVDPDVVSTLVGEGALPNFERLQREGAAARLTSSPPLLSPIIWTTIATGRHPIDHGIAHFTTVDPVSGEEIPITSSLRRTKALWNIFSESQRTVSVVGWWATWPAEAVAGQMFTDRLGYHFLMERDEDSDDRAAGVTFPAEALASVLDKMQNPEDLGSAELQPFVNVEVPELEDESDLADHLGHFRWALATARSYADIGLFSWQDQRPELSMVFIEAVDTASHLFGHLYRQTDLSGELASQQERFGLTVEKMYGFADSLVGQFLDAMDENSTLIVLSDHGFKLGELHTDPSTTRDLRLVSEAYHRLEGVLYLHGRGVRPGVSIERAHILDIAPTVLALANLPVSEEMPGRVLQDALEPMQIIRTASYENGHPAGAAETGSQVKTAADEAILNRLESLGYIGSSSTKNDRNLASLMLQEGRYEEAEEAFRALVALDSEDVIAVASLGASLAGLGRLEEALQHLDLALAMDPDSAMILGARGQVLERRGDREAAMENYRLALRYDPDHEISRLALTNMGVGITGRVAQTEAEIRVEEILQQVVELVKKGDYDAAHPLLEEAQTLAPAEAIVYQYQANVAYLSGDREAAIDALERGLELEPDNPLMNNNLQRLRDSGNSH